MKPRFKAACFDLFDTIIDFNGLRYNNDHIRAAVQLGIEPERFKLAWKQTSQPAFAGVYESIWQRCNAVLNLCDIQSDAAIKKLHDLYKMETDGTFDVLPKKEVIGLRKDMARLEKFLGGIKEMRKLPQALFIIDPRKERNAILEARKLGIPVLFSRII